MKEAIVSVRDLSKSYGPVVGVSGVSFELRRGEIMGLLGPNGAGKTTTLECLEGIRQPDSGTMRILGINPSRESRRLCNVIGVQLQTSGLPATMTPPEAMRFFCAYHGVAPRYDLLERLGLGEKLKAQYRELSTGQQRRLALAVAHQPPILILDEPTAGLDVGSRSVLHEVMAGMRNAGTAILLATHDMAEAEKMADRVAILLRGRIVASGTPRELTATGSGLTKVSVATEQSVLQNSNHPFPAVHQWLVKDDYAIFYSADPGPTVAALLDYVKMQGDKLIDLRVERPSLEERFLEITNAGGAR